jgi:hypothetical protein
VAISNLQQIILISHLTTLHHANNQQVLAEILNKQGNVLVGQKKYSAASSIYQKSQQLAQATGRSVISC